MSDEITALEHFDDASLDTAFTTLAEQVRTESTSLSDPEAFRLHWLGRKQGRLKLVSEVWLKSAPPEAKKALGIRFNQLKQQIEASLEYNRSPDPLIKVPVSEPGLVVEYATQGGTIAHKK